MNQQFKVTKTAYSRYLASFCIFWPTVKWSTLSNSIR